jgi:uncharacterized protein (UPF0335 family)
MEEILDIVRENNVMLKQIISYIEKVESEDYKITEDLKGLVTNLVANMYINNKNIK